MDRRRRKPMAALLTCLLTAWCILFPLSPSATAGDAGSRDGDNAGPAVTDIRSVAGGIRISWETADAAAKYAVYRRVEDGSWVKYTIVSSLFYTDKSVSFGTRYAYAVRSLDSAGAYIGDTGEEKSILYGAAPELNSVLPVSSGVRVSWAQAADAAGYAVYRKTDGGKWIKYSVTSGTSYTDRRVLSGTNYSYTVRAVDRNGIYLSCYDEEGLSILYAAPPVLVSAVNESEGITVTWERADGAEKYAVYRRTEGGSWTRYSVTAELFYTDRHAQEGCRYTYTVMAIKDNGEVVSAFDPTGLTVIRFADPQSSITERLLARQSLNGYAEGSPWGADASYINRFTRNGCAPGCFCGCGDYAFVMDMQEYVMDAAHQVRRVEAGFDSIPAIHAGDALRLDYGTRSVLITAVADDGHTVTVCEGNFGGTVHWGRVIDLSDPSNGLTCVETFY